MTVVAGATKVNKYTYDYKGFKFSYTAKTKGAFKVSLWINHYQKGYTMMRFTKIADAVAYIDSVLVRGGYVETTRNALYVPAANN